MLGSTASRQVDAVFQIYAVNSIGGPFYSFTTSVAAPLVSQSMTNSCITQYTEFGSLARLYNLFQVKGLQILITRNSTLLTNTQIAGNLPSVFFQVSPNLQAPTVSSLTNVALADNSQEFNICTFGSKNYQFNLPPVYLSKSSTTNDYFPFGSMVWLPTLYNGNFAIPDVYLNLGSLASPTFQTGAANTAYAVAQIHIKMNVVFSCPIMQ